jgi:hypothetical protein
MGFISLDGRGTRGPLTAVVLRATLLALVLGGLSGCGTGDESLSGAWLGTFSQEAQERQGTMRLTLSQSGGALGGTWEAEFPPGLRYGGTVEGSVSGSAVSVRLLPDDPEICPYDWRATSGGGRITGRYAAFDCRVDIVGEIDVRRQ